MVKRIFVVVVFSVFMICAYELLKDFGFPHVAILFCISLVFFSLVGVIFYDFAREDYKPNSIVRKFTTARAKLAKTVKRSPPNKGKPMSEAQKKKISDTKKKQFAQKKVQVARNAKGKFAKQRTVKMTRAKTNLKK